MDVEDEGKNDENSQDIEDDMSEESTEEPKKKLSTKGRPKTKKKQPTNKPKTVRKKRVIKSNRTTVEEFKCIACGDTGESIIFKSYHNYGLFVHFCKSCAKGLFIEKPQIDLFKQLNILLSEFKEKGYIELAIRNDKITAYTNKKDIPVKIKKKDDVIAKEKVSERLKKMPTKKPSEEKSEITEKSSRKSINKELLKELEKKEKKKEKKEKKPEKKKEKKPEKEPKRKTQPTQIVNVVNTFDVTTNTDINLRQPLDILLVITDDDTKLNNSIHKYISHESLIKDQNVMCWQDSDNEDNENVFELKSRKRSNFFVYIDSYKLANKHSISGLSEDKKRKLEDLIDKDKHQHMLYLKDTHCYMLNLAQNINILKWLTLHGEDLVTNDPDLKQKFKRYTKGIIDIEPRLKEWYKGDNIPKLYTSYFTIKCLSVLCHILKIVDRDIKVNNNLKDIVMYYCRDIGDIDDFTKIIAWDKLETLINRIKIPEISIENVAISYSAITDAKKKYTFDLYKDKEIHIFDEILELFESKENHDKIDIPYDLTKYLLKIWKSILSLEISDEKRYDIINDKNIKVKMTAGDFLLRDLKKQEPRLLSSDDISIDYSYSLHSSGTDKIILEYFIAIDKMAFKTKDTDIDQAFNLLIEKPLSILSFFKLSHIMSISNSLSIKRCICATTNGQYNDIQGLINTINRKDMDFENIYNKDSLYKDKIKSTWEKISMGIKFNDSNYNPGKDGFYKRMMLSNIFSKLEKYSVFLFNYIPYYLCLEYLDYYLTKTENSKKYRLLKKWKSDLIETTVNKKIQQEHMSKGLLEGELKYRPQFYFTVNTLGEFNFGVDNPSAIINIIACLFLYLIETLPPYLKYLDTTRQYKLSSRITMEQLDETTLSDKTKTLLKNLYDSFIDYLGFKDEKTREIISEFLSEKNTLETFKNIESLSSLDNLDDDDDSDALSNLYAAIGGAEYLYLREPGYLSEAESI